ncbi:MAG TPA: LysM peptidoglycan-binding domain-containing protein [Thermoflexales bacterium]|nr:LysM peptidoglycan-binding domain-containing protein [Thermoflexales bacterium]
MQLRKFGVMALAVAMTACGSQSPAPAAMPVVTIFPTQVMATAAPQAAPLPALAPATPTPAPQKYTVKPNDTSWDIAAMFHLSLDELTSANPGMNPTLIHPGDVLNIPVSGAQVVMALPTPAGPHVDADADGLRLRTAPSTSADVQRYLLALTPLNVFARSADSQWLEVAVPDGTRGWVKAQFVAQVSGLAQLPSKTVTLPPTAAAAAAASAINKTGISAGGYAIPSYLSGFTENARQIYQRGLALGNNPRVFAVIGDSNSASESYLRAFDDGNYDLGAYAALEPSVAYFRGSFNHKSVAAVIGYTALRLLTPPRQPPAGCSAGESLVECEYRLKKPSVALILLGTNDAVEWRTFEENYRDLVKLTIARGIVPVLMTKGDALEWQKYGASLEYVNTIIKNISREYGVPLLDLRSQVLGLPNGGLVSDGIHFNTSPDGKSTYFTGAHMNYGNTIRNLTALQALDAVRKLILDGR